MKGNAVTVARRATSLHAEIQRLGLDVVDMRAESHLELTHIGQSGPDERPNRIVAAKIEHLEEKPVIGRAVARGDVPSRLRYFLDGVQRTKLVYMIDGVPVATCLQVAGILERDQDGLCRLLPGSQRFEQTWLLPTRSGRFGLDRLADLILDHGGRIADPLTRHAKTDADYEAMLDDYSTLVSLAYDAGSKLREEIETQLLDDWPSLVKDDGWIVVDGPLRIDTERAVGLVKSFTKQYLSGAEAWTLFRLPADHRTSAFIARDLWREDEPARTHWYQRFWSPSGRDVRHALVRVEVSPAVTEPAEIDRLAGWLMAERRPRAVADERWATLLYPVHLLEQVLKQRLQREMRGWPVP